MPIVSLKNSDLQATIKVQGEFDNKNCIALKSSILSMISDGMKVFKIDLSETDYIDSPGIGILLSIYFTLEKLNGSLVIENPPTHIGDLLEATQVTKYIRLEFNTSEVESFE